MSNIKNPAAYWQKVHNDDKNKQLNKDLEYFFTNPYSTEQRVYNLIESINKWGVQFNYVTNYLPYNKALISLPNLIIDPEDQKLILIPQFSSFENARTFDDPNYNQFKRFIEKNFYNIPSDEFLEFINSNRFRFVYVTNNFNETISNCEKRNKIKISFNLIEEKISYTIVVDPPPTIVKKETASSIYVPPHLRSTATATTATATTATATTATDSNITTSILAPALKPIIVAPALKPIIVSPHPLPPHVFVPVPNSANKLSPEKPKSTSEIWAAVGSPELMQQFINEDSCGASFEKSSYKSSSNQLSVPLSKLLSAPKIVAPKIVAPKIVAQSHVLSSDNIAIAKAAAAKAADEAIAKAAASKLKPPLPPPPPPSAAVGGGGGVGGGSSSTKSVPKTTFINFEDKKFSQLKQGILKELNGNPTDEKLDWLNNLFHNIFMYHEFLAQVKNSEYLIIDQENQKLIRKKIQIERNIFNPEETD
jgi:hypothetical protein